MCTIFIYYLNGKKNLRVFETVQTLKRRFSQFFLNQKTVHQPSLKRENKYRFLKFWHYFNKTNKIFYSII